MNRVRRKWLRQTELLVAPHDRAVARNATITSLYARWYTAHPSLLKWAGMAVFASNAAGRYLRVLDVATPHSHRGPAEGSLKQLARSARAAFVDPHVDLLRRTNNGVFEDIAWTHVAFLSPKGGIDAVREGLADLLTTHRRLLDGFERLDASRRVARDDPARAERLAWEGSRLLLEHEQRFIVQPLFASFEPWFARFYSILGAADFDLNPFHLETTSFTAFTPYMLLHGRSQLRTSGSWRPDLTDFAQRWFWIDNHALPCWMRAESHPSVRAKIRDLAVRSQPI